VALLSVNDTRDVCARLFAASLISMQEVPKSADRSNPQRMFFLWYVDEAKSRAWLLDHLYKTQARLAQRRREEARRQEALLRKTERSDVKMDAATLLADWEKEQLTRLNKTLELLTVEEMRTDLDAFVVSHLPG
jgi:DNA-directed RNA polymerase III subunit RPC3